MIIGSSPSFGSVRASERDLSVRDEAAARQREPPVATVEIVRPLDPQSRLRADTDVLRSEPTTERRRVDIRV